MPQAVSDDDDDAYVPLNRRPNPDLVSFGPTNDDSPGFAAGLWGAEAVLLAAVIGGFTVLRPLGDLVNVVTALASLLLFVALYAIVLRGRLRPLSTSPAAIVVRIVAVAALVAFAVVATRLAMLGSSGAPRPLMLIVAGSTWLLGQTAVVAAYFSRMFRWRGDPPRL